MNFKRRQSLVFVVLLLAAASCRKERPAEPKPVTKTLPVVGVANYGAHPVIDVTVKAFKERMSELGYKDGENIKLLWKSVEGNVNLAPQVVSSLLAAGPKVLVSITTPISQAVVKQARNKVPVVFCGVTDPISAGLVKTWGNTPGSGVTGTSDRWPYAQQLDLVKELAPKAKKVGVPYNSGEANSQYALKQIEPLAKERGLEVVTAVATSEGEVRKAVDSLVTRGVDAIYTGSDNTVMAGFQSILKVAHERKIPVVCGESASLERGCLGTFSVDYTELGRKTADLVDRILKGARPGSLSVVTFEGKQLYLNPDAAEKMGVTLSEAMLNRAEIKKTKTE